MTKEVKATGQKAMVWLPIAKATGQKAMVCPPIGKATVIKAWPDGYGRSGVMIKFGVRQSFDRIEQVEERYANLGVPVEVALPYNRAGDKSPIAFCVNFYVKLCIIVWFTYAKFSLFPAKFFD